MKKKKLDVKTFFNGNIGRLEQFVDKLYYEFMELREIISNYKKIVIRKHDRFGNDITDDPYDETGFIKNSWLSEAKKKNVKLFNLPKNEYDLKLEEVERKDEEYYRNIEKGARMVLNYSDSDYGKNVSKLANNIRVIPNFDFIRSDYRLIRNLKIWWFKFRNRNNPNIILPTKYEELLTECFEEMMQQVFSNELVRDA